MWNTTIRGLVAHKLRLALTALAVVLGVAFMTGTMVLTDTISRTFDALMADVYDGTDAVVRAQAPFGSGNDGPREAIPSSILAPVQQVAGVKAAEGAVSGYAQIVGTDGKAIGDPGRGAPALGLSWSTVPELNPFRIVEGHPPAGGSEVAIDRATATKGRLRLGDTAKVLLQSGPREFRVVGIATFGDADSAAGATTSLFDLATAQEAMGRPGQFNEIMVVAADGVSQAQLAARLARVVPTGSQVLTGRAYTEENQASSKQGLSFFSNFLMSFAVVALFVGSFIIYNTFSMVVAQRRREMALLRALGASRRQVLRSVLVEAAVVGVLASLAGVGFGVVLAGGLKALLAAMGIDIPTGATVLSGRTIVTALVVGSAVTVVSAFVPARKAGKVPPVAAMRDAAAETPSRSWLRPVTGSLTTALGVGLLMFGLSASIANAVAVVAIGGLMVMLGVIALAPMLAVPFVRVVGSPLPRVKGVTGRLSQDNAVRNPKRTSATAAALMIGVSLVTFITVDAASAKSSTDANIDKTLRADLVVTAAGGVSPALAQRLQTVNGVSRVSGLRTGEAQISGVTRHITAVDPSSIGSLVDLGVSRGSLSHLGPGIAVHRDAATTNGWKVGDTINLSFTRTGVVALTVAAIFDNKDLIGSDYVVSSSTYERNVTDQFDRSVFVKVASGADQSEVRAAVDRVVDQDFPSAAVADRSQYKEVQAAAVDQMLNLVYALLLLAIVIALIGITNTLSLSIFERTRELGLLRAVGLTRRQLRSTVRWEAAIISLYGTGLGLALGLFFGWALVTALGDQGLNSFVVPAGPLAVVVLVSVVAGVVAAIGPARRAARLDVLAAVRSE